MTRQPAMRFVCSFASALFVLAAVTSAAPIPLAIDDTKPLQTVEPHFCGVNLVAFWDDSQDSPAVPRAIARLSPGYIRFPGGSAASNYDWENPVDAGGYSSQRAWEIAHAAGARMIFQTNAANDKQTKSGQTGKEYKLDSSGEHAAGWVKLAKEKRMDVAWWEIGNEPECESPPAQKQESQAAIYAFYNAKFAEQAKAIKAADPQAKVMGPASVNTWYWWHEENLAKFLAAHGDKQGSGLVDAVSIHWFGDAGGKPWDQARGTAQELRAALEHVRKVMKEHDSRDLPLYVTQWNWGAGDNDSAKQMRNALGCADAVGEFRQGGVKACTLFCLKHVDKAWGILAVGNDYRDENTPSATFFALALTNKMGEEVLAVKNGADAAAVLSAYAARDAKGGIQVLLVNKSKQKQVVDLSFANLKPAGKKAAVYTLAGLNGKVEDEDVLYNGQSELKPAEQELPQPKVMDWPADGMFTVEPYSLMLVEVVL